MDNLSKYIQSQGFDLRMITTVNGETHFYFKDTTEAQRAWDYFTQPGAKDPADLDGWYYGVDEREEVESGYNSQIVFNYE